jgi:hypothetical protein
MRWRVVLAVAVVWLGVLEGTAAARDRWVLIGTRDIDLSKDSESVDVSDARGAFKAFRVEAKRQGIDLTKVRLVYGDGTGHNEDRLIHLLKGERSKPIDARDGHRFIDRVELSFKANAGAGSPARVEIWALQSDDGLRARRDGPQPRDEGRRETAVATPDKPERTKPSEARPGERTEAGDIMFGYQDVGFGLDQDTIRVGSETGKFARLRLRVLKNDVFVKSLKVVYTDGSTQDIVLDAPVKRGARTEWYDVNGGEFIREIQMLYRSRPNVSGQARVEVTGQYAANWLGAEGEGRKFNEGWVLLGAQSAGMFGASSIKAFGFDKDVIPVGANEGGFKKLRIKVRNRSITLKELRVVYVDGTDTVIDRRTRVDPDQIEGPWDIKADAPIKQIVASYRGRIVWGKGTGVPVVEIWGQH